MPPCIPNRWNHDTHAAVKPDTLGFTTTTCSEENTPVEGLQCLPQSQVAGIQCTTTDPKSTILISASARRRAGNYPPASAPGHDVTGNQADHNSPRLELQSADGIDARGFGGTPPRAQPIASSTFGNVPPVQGRTGLPHAASTSRAPDELDRSGVNSEAEGESPEYAFNTTGQSEHKYLGPSSLQVFTQWLEMTFRVETANLSERFRYGMRHCEEMDIPDVPEMPQLPQDWFDHLRAFTEQVAPLFPIVHGQEMEIVANSIVSRNPSDMPKRQRPTLALLYACIAIGIRQRVPSSTESAKYLRAACSLLSYTIAYPYLESAQALLMLTIALRCHSRDGAASQALGSAIRILQSIGLHRQASTQQMSGLPSSGNTANGDVAHSVKVQQVQEVWWSAYCLERISGLECGRPSSINDEDIDQDPSIDQLQAPLQAYMISLAKIQGDVSRQLFSNCTRQLVNSPREIFHIQSRLDRQLGSWYAELPQSIKLDGELLTSSPKTRSARAFLLLQYHSTVATVHRSALLINQNIHLANLRRAELGPDKEDRLLESKNICISAAREIARCFLQVLERNTNTAIISMTEPLMAVYILAIKNLRDPGSWMARSDLSLLHSATEAIETRYRLDGQDPGFYFMLKLLQQFATARESGSLQNNAMLPMIEQAEPATALNESAMYDPSQDWNSLFPRLFLGDIPVENNDVYQDDIFGMMDIPQLTEEEILSFTILPGFEAEGNT
ncbi:Fungal specific transcription factor domain-containing protein 1 [Elsinoe fawcettii]|nr:Fungal specific transcription factor domain-containing protein 1 [Elsinoe fawcettii]